MNRRVLIYNHPELGEQRFELEIGRSYRIGARSDNDIVVPQKDVSRRHAVLHVGPVELQITDLGSKNGTFVNGRSVRSETFHCGDRLTLSSAKLGVVDISTGAFQLAPEISATIPPKRGPESREDTVHEEHEVGREGLVALFEATADNVADAELTPLLSWIVERFGLRAAMVIRSDEHGRHAVVANAGEWGELLASTARLESLVRRVGRLATVSGDGAEAIEVEEMTVGVELDAERALILELRENPPSVFELRAINAAVRAALLARDRAAAEAEARRPRPSPPGRRTVRIVGDSAALRSCEEQALRYAKLEEPVMILGESGTGKELFARLIHEVSGRGSGPFVPVNCAAIPTDLIEAELFGVAPGAATGVGERPGKFHSADGGTLFLDEIGDLPMGLQGKLLRVLEMGELFRVGDDHPRQCDVRVVSATNRDIEADVRREAFRADLFYRLHVLPLVIPPLRERREDVAPLFEHFLDRAATERGRIVGGCTVEALNALKSYPWPGNVRELRSEVTRVLVSMVDGAVIDVDNLSPHVVRTGGDAGGRLDLGAVEDLPLADAVDMVERALVRAALDACTGNRTRAAERLGMTRAGLFKKMRRLGLIDDQADSSG